MKIMEKLEDLAQDPLGTFATPREVIQLLRGKLYFSALTMLTLVLQSEEAGRKVKAFWRNLR